MPFRLRVTVVGAKGLAPKDANGLSDPYIRFFYKNRKYKTSTKPTTLNPEWNECFTLDVEPGPSAVIRFEVWDFDNENRDDPIGYADVDFSGCYLGPSEAWYPLHTADANTPNCGELRLRTEPMQGGPAPAPVAGGYGMTTEGKHQTVKSLKEIMPDMDAAVIRRVCEKHNWDKEKALDELLNMQMSRQEAENKPAANTANVGASVYGGELLGHESQHDVGFRPAASYVPDLTALSSTKPGRRKALLIGINYEGQAKLQLRGCIPDVSRMKKLLITHYGFAEGSTSMVALTDDTKDKRYLPTKKNIIGAMEWLIVDSRPGDSYFFHFSGHGSQEPDKTGMEDDAMNETIVPLDWKQAGQIIDDEIHEILVEPLPSGCRLTSVMDCCHSGTGMDLPFNWMAKGQTWGEDDNPCYVEGDVQLFSGCKDSQTSADTCQPGQAGGAMTTAFVSTLSENPHGHTYPSLMETLSRNISRRGLPQTSQLSSTQRFRFDRSFNFDDVVPNHNKNLGRQRRRVNKPKYRMPEGAGTAAAAGLGALGGMLMGMLIS